MKIIEPYFEFIDEPDPLKKIEICGRVCYKSESKITSDSAETFVKNLIRSGHESVLEHAVYIVLCDDTDAGIFNRICNTIERRNGGRVFLKSTQKRRNIISGNVRAWRDFMRECEALRAYPKFLTLFGGVLFDDVNPRQYWKPTRAYFIDKSDLLPEERDAHYTETVRFVVDRGISHEIVRHRTASFSQESTRYCNYSGDKFGSEITVIRPFFWNDDPEKFEIWKNAMAAAEKAYNDLIAAGATAQEARSVLPNSLKTEIVMTMNMREWRHFFKLRTAPAAHPQMREVAVPMLQAFKELLPSLFSDIEAE